MSPIALPCSWAANMHQADPIQHRRQGPRSPTRPREDIRRQPGPCGGQEGIHEYPAAKDVPCPRPGSPAAPLPAAGRTHRLFNGHSNHPGPACHCEPVHEAE